MKYYLDITLLPDGEANFGFLWQAVYRQVHLALVESKTPKGDSTVSVSIPEYGARAFPLGSKLRLLASSKGSLESLDIDKWLARLKDYTHSTSIKSVPEKVTQFARFNRRQFKTNIQRLARRRMKRQGVSFEEAIEYYASFKDKESKLPYINMKSLSKDESFKFFIEQELLAEPIEGVFNCYGLSGAATVPWF